MTETNTPAPFVFKFDPKNWETYPIGLHKKNIAKGEQALKNTLERVMKLLPGIKKSSKLLVLSRGNTQFAEFLAYEYMCHVDIMCHTEAQAKAVEKYIKTKDFDEKKVAVKQCSFNELMLDREHYDIVFSLAELYNEDDTLLLFKEIARSLVPEGRFIMLEVFDTFEDEVELDGYENITSMDNILRRGRRADLERVYAKLLPEKTIQYYKGLVDKSSDKIKGDSLKRLKKLNDYASGNAINWGIIQFQKRNI
jgi:sarcosine/dimethylglycine N-methyltransferase